MTNNPLRRASPAAFAGPIDWRVIAAERNANMARNDVEWAVNAKGDGIYLRYRHQPGGGWREWKPELGEIEATNELVARAINAGLPMEEWARLVRNGSITREVQKAMRGLAA